MSPIPGEGGFVEILHLHQAICDASKSFHLEVQPSRS